MSTSTEPTAETMDSGAGDERLERERRFTERETARPLATSSYFTEFHIALGAEGEDGRHMMDVLQRQSDEVNQIIMSRGGLNCRELAMIQTKLDEAAHWALALGRREGIHLVIDRRRFATEEEPSDEVES